MARTLEEDPFRYPWLSLVQPLDILQGTSSFPDFLSPSQTLLRTLNPNPIANPIDSQALMDFKTRTQVAVLPACRHTVHLAHMHAAMRYGRGTGRVLVSDSESAPGPCLFVGHGESCCGAWGQPVPLTKVG